MQNHTYSIRRYRHTWSSNHFFVSGMSPHVIAGFNFNDPFSGEGKFSQLPGSGTPNVSFLTTTSNVGSPGLWIFRVDENEIGTYVGMSMRLLRYRVMYVCS